MSLPPDFDIHIRKMTEYEQERYKADATDVPIGIWLAGELIGWTDDYGTAYSSPYREVALSAKPQIEHLVKVAGEVYHASI